jgi:hypothetical protein
MVDCKIFSEQRFKCHAVYGKGGEDCLHQELSEKRCLSLYHCKQEAHDYYGEFPMTTTNNTTTTTDSESAPIALTNKALCASWAESFAYVDKEMEYGPDVANHHQQAKDIVTKDRRLMRECREIVFALAQCLRKKQLF